MLRIGDAAKRFAVSSRTLRYWEEEGIVTSARMENGYRFYDEANTARIRQIVLLRKLWLPITDIERIFRSGDAGAAIDALVRHLEKLRREQGALDSLTLCLEQIICQVKNEKDLPQVLTYLETHHAIFSGQADAPPLQLSERIASMTANELNNVRIVHIPELTVAACRAESETPEQDCGSMMDRFILANALHKRSGFRHLGFNNPSPSEGSPVYGYEMWVTIPEDFSVPAPLEKKKFGGGLYASISTNMSEIGERWMDLHNWCLNSEKYSVEFSIQWLEENVNYQPERGADQLDLLEPISVR